MSGSQALQFKPLRGITGPGLESHVSVGLTAGVVFDQNIPPSARWVMFQAVTQNIRFTLTGTSPSTTIGFQVFAGDPPYLIGIQDIPSIKFCAEVTGASLQLEFGM